MRNWKKLFLATAASSALIGGTSNAASLVNLSILGSTTLNGSYTSTVPLSGLSANETIYVEVIGQLASSGCNTYGGKVINTLSSTKDGIGSLDFDLNWSGSATLSNIGLATPTSTVKTTGTNTATSGVTDWTSGSSTSAGTVGTDIITGIRPALSGVDTGTVPPSSDVLWFGQLSIPGSAATAVSGSWYDTGSGGSGGFKINGGSSVLISKASETSSDPYVSYAPLNLTEPSPAVPAPSILDGMLVLAGGLGVAYMASRRRLAMAV